MTGDMRDRLIELLRCAPFCGYRFDDRYSVGAITPIADHLIANGVILPPCKVGDTVYKLHTANLEPTGKITKRIITQVSLSAFTVTDDGAFGRFDFDDFGKTVFFTREEAEKALKEALAQ